MLCLKRCFSIVILLAFAGGVETPTADAGILSPFGWLADKFVPSRPQPEDPHVYPDGTMLYDMWTCKGENDFGWVGVTQKFTDEDPYILVVVRTEFDEMTRMREDIGVEIIAPRHNRIIASDRVRLDRNQDIAFFYNPLELARRGGWGEYTAVLNWDGVPRDELTFELVQVQDLQDEAAIEAQQAEAQQAFESQFLGEQLEARALLGEPDAAYDSPAPEDESEPAREFFDLGSGGLEPQMVVRDPRDRHRLNFANEEGEIIVFPKKARKDWKENAKGDLKYRVARYYVFL